MAQKIGMAAIMYTIASAFILLVASALVADGDETFSLLEHVAFSGFQYVYWLAYVVWLVCACERYKVWDSMVPLAYVGIPALIMTLGFSVMLNSLGMNFARIVGLGYGIIALIWAGTILAEKIDWRSPDFRLR